MTDPLVGDIAQSITTTLARFEDPSQRIFWPFLLSSAVLALAVLLLKRESVAKYLSPKVWLHPSARMDYRLFFANALLKSLLWGGMLVSAVAVVVATDRVLRVLFGSVGSLGLATWQITTIYTIVLFVGLDASRYLLHRLMHNVPLLWHFHQVHHSAEVLTPITVYRVHPVESFLYGMRGAIFTGLITGVFWFLFREEASQAELLGVNAIGITLNALGANLRHSHVWLSYGRLEELLLSPAQHQMHHGIDADEAQVNYGAFLSIWDKLAGSFRRAEASRKPERFGLEAAERNHEPDSVLSAYVGPTIACTKDVAAALAPAIPRPATALLAVTSLQCTSNGDGGGGAPDAADDGFDRAGLVQNLSENVILPHYDAAEAASQSLADAIDSLCAGIDGETEAALLGDARTAWMDAMVAWQKAELSIIGPASPDELAYRDLIYSWPVISACAVDQAVMDNRENAGFDLSTQLVNRRGLDALEYLLFNESEDSICAPQIRPEGWDALSSLEKRNARCTLAQAVADDLISQQSALTLSWTESGGFLESLTTAGDSGSDFGSAQESLNVIFGGLFYLEVQTKDVKLGASVGASENPCNVTDAACPASLESAFADVSKESITANLDAFEEFFEGNGGLGFADFMEARGGGAKVDEMREAIIDANLALDAIDAPLRDALDSNFAEAQVAYEAMRAVTGILKNDMPALLQLDIPASAGGDAD